MTESIPFKDNPQENPYLIDEAAGDPALLNLIAEEVAAAGELFVDPHDPEKLERFTSKQAAVLTYKEAQAHKNNLRPTTD